jgi:hypothetical protein
MHVFYCSVGAIVASSLLAFFLLVCWGLVEAFFDRENIE